MRLVYLWLFPAVWLLFVLYWWISALFVKRIERGEPDRERVVRFILVWAAAWLMYSPRIRAGILSQQIIPQTPATFFTGAVVLLIGLGFAVWARVHLGAYWSAMVAVKEGHRLIRSGPYRMVRHPIYTGILTGLAGSGLALGQLRSLLAVACFIAIYVRKSRHEERLLAAQFPQEYPGYRTETGALIPTSGWPQIAFWCGAVIVALIAVVARLERN